MPPNDFDYSQYVNPDWLPGAFDYETPKEGFDRFRSAQPDFFRRQAGLVDWNERMRARYMLDAPAMLAGEGAFVRPGGVPGPAPTMANPNYYDYLNQYQQGAYRPSMQSYGELLGLAQQAASAGVTAPGAYMAAGDLADQADMNRRAWLSSQFGGQGGAANQRDVAALLALQRNRGPAPGVADYRGGSPRGGAYTGQMATAIRRAMNAMYQQHLNRGQPKESFLDWYLSESGQAAKTAGAAGTDAYGGEL